MPGKSLQQRVSDTEKRIQQLEAQRQLLNQRLKQQERKARTRRLIQVGAIISSTGLDTPEKAQLFQQACFKDARVRAWLTKLLESAGAEETGTEDPT